MTPNEVYDGSQNQMSDWVHQLDKLDQSYGGTCTPGQLSYSHFIPKLSTNAADAGKKLKLILKFI